MLTVLVLSTKGGCGKTTMATNLAAALSQMDYVTTLADMDPQYSSSWWWEQRQETHTPTLELVDWTRSFTRVPGSTEWLVVDAPAALPQKRVEELVRRADVIVVPVLPSRFDEHATRNLLKELEQMKLIRRNRRDVAIVANKVRPRFRTSQWLDTFLSEVGHPVVTRLSDSQLYPVAADEGLALADYDNKRSRALLSEWDPLFDFLQDVAEDPASASSFDLGRIAARWLRTGA